MSSPLRAFFSHHKCATQWVVAILDELSQRRGLHHAVVHNAAMFGEDLGGFVAARGVDVLSYINAEWPYVEPSLNPSGPGSESPRGFHLVRDPRDILVSGYFSHLYSHPTEGWPQLAEHRGRLERVSVEEGLLLEMDFSADVFAAMAGWRYDHPAILELQMEAVTARPAEAFSAICDHLRIDVASGKLERILERYAFRRLAEGRTRGEEDVRSHYRRGEPGDWRNHFTAEHVAAFRQRHQGLLERLGYEDDAAWG